MAFRVDVAIQELSQKTGMSDHNIKRKLTKLRIGSILRRRGAEPERFSVTDADIISYLTK